jgi:hypothetical protein
MVTTGLGFAIVTFWPLAHRYLAGLAAVTAIALVGGLIQLAVTADNK